MYLYSPSESCTIHRLQVTWLPVTRVAEKWYRLPLKPLSAIVRTHDLCIVLVQLQLITGHLALTINNILESSRYWSTSLIDKLLRNLGPPLQNQLFGQYYYPSGDILTGVAQGAANSSQQEKDLENKHNWKCIRDCCFLSITTQYSDSKFFCIYYYYLLPIQNFGFLIIKVWLPTQWANFYIFWV